MAMAARAAPTVAMFVRAPDAVDADPSFRVASKLVLVAMPAEAP